MTSSSDESVFEKDSVDETGTDDASEASDVAPVLVVNVLRVLMRTIARALMLWVSLMAPLLYVIFCHPLT